MRAVTERLVVRAFAAAQVERARAVRHEAVRLQGRRLVRAIAEGLLRRAPARAPEIRFPGLQRHLVRALLGAERLVGHLATSLAAVSDPVGLTPTHVTLSFIFSTTLAPASSTQV